MKEIDRVFTKYPFFESRQIAAYLRREGRSLNTRTIPVKTESTVSRRLIGVDDLIATTSAALLTRNRLR